MTLKKSLTAKKVLTPSKAVSMDLFDQPGHLIRRANQIAVGMFNDLVGKEVTPIQYAILRMVFEHPGIDQVSLAHRIALDTSTAALTAARLETKGLLARQVAQEDRRQLQLVLTKEGEHLLEGLVTGVHDMRKALLCALDSQEQAIFMKLLRKLVHLHNEQSRAPMRLTTAGKKTAKPSTAHPKQTTKPVSEPEVSTTVKTRSRG